MSMKSLVTVFLAGILFSTGAGVAGLTQPETIVGFLDFFGAWNPSVLFVMMGAVTVYAVAHRFTARMKKPVYAAGFMVPTRRDIDAKLVAGASLFGFGWGLVGLCPGPAVTVAATGSLPIFLFLGAALSGMLFFQMIEPLLNQKKAQANKPSAMVDKQPKHAAL